MRYTPLLALSLLLTGCTGDAAVAPSDAGSSDAEVASDTAGPLQLPDSLVYPIGPAAEQPRAVAGDRLVYVYSDQNGDWDTGETGAVMSTRGTPETIVELVRVSCLPRALASIGPKVVFEAIASCGMDNNWNRTASGVHLQATDGTGAPPIALSEPLPGEWYASTTAVVAGGIYYGVGAAQGLWRSDGTPEGTFQLIDEAFVRHVTVVGDRVVAFTETTVAGSGPSWPWAMWVSDGTLDGTVLVSDLHEPTGAASTSPDWVYVRTKAGLYVSNLTEQGTRWLPDIEVFGLLETGQRVLVNTAAETPQGEIIVQAQALEGDGLLTPLVERAELSMASGLDELSVFATVDDRLFATDGSAAGTELLVDLGAQEREFDGGLGHAGDRILFGVRRTPLYVPFPEERWEIWSTQGTPETTEAVAFGYEFHRPLQLGGLMTFDSDRQLHALRLDLLP